MSDEIIKDLWEIKDSIAREHRYDIDRLVAYLRTRQRPKGHPVVDLRRGTGRLEPSHTVWSGTIRVSESAQRLFRKITR